MMWKLYAIFPDSTPIKKNNYCGNYSQKYCMLPLTSKLLEEMAVKTMSLLLL